MTRRLAETFEIEARTAVGENWQSLVRISTELREITDLRNKLRSTDILVRFRNPSMSVLTFPINQFLILCFESTMTTGEAIFIWPEIHRRRCSCRNIEGESKHISMCSQRPNGSFTFSIYHQEVHATQAYELYDLWTFIMQVRGRWILHLA